MPRPPSSPHPLLDVLYRYRWWTTAAAVAVLVVAAPDGDALQPVAWLVYALLLVLVWIPTAVRWGRRLAESRSAYRRAVAGH